MLACVYVSEKEVWKTDKENYKQNIKILVTVCTRNWNILLHTVLFPYTNRTVVSRS